MAKETKSHYLNVVLTDYLGNFCIFFCHLSSSHHPSDSITIILFLASLVFLSPEPPINSPVGRNGFDTQSDVYKMLQDYEEPVSEPKQSGSFKYLQGILEAEDGGRGFCVWVCLCASIMPGGKRACGSVASYTTCISCYFPHEQGNYQSQVYGSKTRIQITEESKFICLNCFQYL